MISTADQVRIHANLSYTFLGLSLALNSMVFVLIRKSEKLDSFRYVFFAYCVTDTLFASVHAISLMYWAHLPKSVVFFPTGALGYLPLLTPIAFQLQSLAYVFVMCLVCSTYLHRYRLVKRQTYSPDSNITKLINRFVYFPVFQWFVTCAILMRPNCQLRSKANQLIGDKYELDFERIYFVGVDINVLSDVGPVLIVSGLSLFVEMIVLIGVLVWCGLGIHRFIKSSMTNERSKRVQRRVLKLLIFQAVHPILLLHAPSIINFAQLLFDFQLSDDVRLYSLLNIDVFFRSTCFLFCALPYSPSPIHVLHLSSQENSGHHCPNCCLIFFIEITPSV